MMRQALRKLFPSMFQRRVLLLALLMVVVFAALGLQMARLTLAQGARRRAEAEAVLSDVAYIPTSRGRIEDRYGVVLAWDKPARDVAVRYPVISGQWAYEQAYRDAVRADRQRWHELDYTQREHLVAQHQVPYDAQVLALWQKLCELGGVPPLELEERKQTVTRRIAETAASTRRQRLAQRARELAETPIVPPADLAQPIGEQLAAHALLVDIDDAGALQIERLIYAARQFAQSKPQGDSAVNPLAVWREVSVEPSKRRDYPLETMSLLVDTSHFPTPLRQAQPAEVTVRGVGLHLLGAVRQVQAEDRAAPFRRAREGREEIDLRGYLPGDSIGGRGLERSQEAVLRGARGMEYKHFDTGELETTAPVPGGNVRLSIDIQLQARLQALLSPQLGLMRMQPWHSAEAATSPDLGRPLNGAALVLEVATGEVLAAVSVPTYSLHDLAETPHLIWNDKLDYPFMNRALGVPYQPGSTLKPVVLSAAITAGKVGPHDPVTCTGFLDEHSPDHFRCWIFRKTPGAIHGPLAGAEAIARSCNIYFYTLGRRMGYGGLVDWFDRFGLGRPTGCVVDDEVAGFLPPVPRRPPARGQGGSEQGDATNMGIGQGPVAWTLLQAANCYATLARGGYLLSPTLLHQSGRSRRHDTDLGLHPAAVRTALQGLEEAVSQRYGTGHHLAALGGERVFDITGVRVMGKSGTAETTPQRIRRPGQPDTIVRDGDHAWFIGLVQKPGSSRPDFVVAVVVEHAGSGGATAGPIANQVLHALRALGYL